MENDQHPKCIEGISYLEEKWSQFKLYEEDQDVIMAEDTQTEDDKIKERHSLIGKIFTEQYISKETIGGLMGKIWRISKPTIFTEVEKTCPSLRLLQRLISKKVVNGKPWLFDGHLFVLQNMDGKCQLAETMISTECLQIQIHNLPFHYMNRFYGNLMGGKVGKVLEIEVDDYDTKWGEFLRIRVEINLNKPLL